jgi:hypothetical protein
MARMMDHGLRVEVIYYRRTCCKTDINLNFGQRYKTLTVCGHLVKKFHGTLRRGQGRNSMDHGLRTAKMGKGREEGQPKPDWSCLLTFKQIRNENKALFTHKD